MRARSATRDIRTRKQCAGAYTVGRIATKYYLHKLGGGRPHVTLTVEKVACLRPRVVGAVQAGPWEL